MMPRLILILGAALAGCSLAPPAIVHDSCPPIGSGYGDTNSATGLARSQAHTGIDIMAPVGHPVLAAADGTAIIATVRLADGGLIIIDHGPWDDIRHLYTFYAHLSRLDVRAGARVRRGEVIGAVGRTGSLAGQLPHLHFETRTTVGPGSVRTLGGEPFLWGRGRRTEDPANFWLLEGQRIAPFRPGAPVPEGARGLTYPVAC